MMPERRALIDELLQKTSRTFALAIPLLPEPLRAEVGVGYLLLRIADTLEDAECLGRDERLRELGRFIELLSDPTEAHARQAAACWQQPPPSTNGEYNRLMVETPAVLAELNSLDPAAVEILKRHVTRSTLGMAETLRRADTQGSFRLDSIDELRRYCYFVAGIVGEMLTELFQRQLALSPTRDALAADAAAFGEGLQLVNILRDAASDAGDGRVYLPQDSQRREILDLVCTNLAAAERYADNLVAAGADGGIVAFATLPRTLAEATLDVLQSEGGKKVTREVVAAKLAQVQQLVGTAGETP